MTLGGVVYKVYERNIHIPIFYSIKEYNFDITCIMTIQYTIEPLAKPLSHLIHYTITPQANGVSY